MERTTQIVTIEPEHLAELQEWVGNRHGTIEPDNKIKGTYGTIDRNAEARELIRYVRMEVAQRQPQMRCPPVSDMPQDILDDLFRMAADSYDWIHESHFDDIDLPYILEVVQPALQPRSSMAPPDADAKLRHLTQFWKNDNAGQWATCTPTQQALIQEAFEGSKQWQSSMLLEEDIRQQLIDRLRQVDA